MPFLIAAAVDELAKTQPDKRFALVPERVDSTEGAKDVTWAKFRRSVDKAAAWIEAEFGPAAPGNPSLGFLATPFDFRYCIFIIAAIKTGYKLFLPSPRNSPEFHTHLLDKLECSKFISTQPLGEWASGRKVVTTPSLDELLDAADVKPYPYEKTWDEAKDDELVVVHSSGSTGMPKPIKWTNAWMDATRGTILHGTNGKGWFQLFTNEMRMVAMPLFHTAGCLVGPLFGIITNEPMTLFPASAMINANTVVKLIETFDFKSALMPPSILEDISADPEMLKVITKLTAIGFAGGPVASEAGDLLCQYCPVYAGMGSSEAGMYPLNKLTSEIKQSYVWFQIDDLPGFDFEVQDDGLYEIVLKRTDKFDWPIFHTFPDVDRYETKDLFEKHPSVPNAWRLVSRTDDVLILSNGEKVVPLPMEEIIRLAPEVKGVLYAGQGRFMVSAVIELTEEAQSKPRETVLKALKPYIDNANKRAPGFARLSPNMIIFTSNEKPMRRTGKGSIMRKAVLLKDYADEINTLYKQQEESQQTIKLVKDTDEAGTVDSLVELFEQLSGKQISAEEDLFQSAGIDSMQVLGATRVLRASVKAESSKKAKVAPGLIYEHPTIKALAAAVRSLVIDGSVSSDEHHHVEAMEHMLLEYSHGILAANPQAKKLASPENVVITGTTGSLGSYILDILIRDSSIKRVFALNRSQNASSRQSDGNASRGLSTDFSKVTFLTADFGSKNLGLPSTEDYRTIRDSADLIIHSAWPVDFNQALASFEPHVRGVRNFIDLAAASHRVPQIVFFSSIATTNFWDSIYPGENRPETLLRDARVAVGQGYGEGKYVAEHLLNAASKVGIHTTIARVGQVGGPVEHGTNGIWNKQEWFPSIIASSKYLGVLPDSLANDVANFVPVDSMAKAVIELGVHDIKKASEVTNPDKKSQGSFAVYNLVNPKGGSYSKLIPTIREHLPQIKEVVSFDKWVETLRASTEKDDNDVDANPATKLVDFYEGFAGSGMPDAFDTDAAVGASKTMSEISAVKPEWMDTWMAQWKF